MRARLPILALAVALLFPRPGHAEEARLTVLHTTDLHGALDAWDYLQGRPADRGLTRIATLVAKARAEGTPTLLLDNGDALQGGVEYGWGRTESSLPDPMIAAMNRMGYDAMSLGNHEFSGGVTALRRAEGAARFPLLGANVVRETGGLAAFGTSLIRNVGALRVGVVGLTTPAVPALEDSANWAGLRFDSALLTAQLEVGRLRQKEHCDVVILLAHAGLEREKSTEPEKSGDTPGENVGFRLATEVPGVDVVILGHTHVVIPSADLYGTLVTQAGKSGEQLGRVDLVLTRAGAGDRWTLSRKSARMLAVSDSVADDTALVALARPYHEAAEHALSRAIGVAKSMIGSPRGRLENGPLWDLIHRVQLAASGADVSLSALPDPAARIAPGPVTVRDVLRAYPYDNSLGMVEMTADDLRLTLEQSAEYFAPYTYEAERPLTSGARPGYNFDAAVGVGYEVDLTRPVGQRVTSMTFQGQPLAMDRKLRVVVNGYRLNGGGGFERVRAAPRIWRSSESLPRLIEDYVAAHAPLDGGYDHSWRLLPVYVATPERPLIDLLARQGAAPIAELLRLEADEPAKRGDAMYWLSRAFGWREKRFSGAFADVPDSLEPWMEGLLRRKVLGEAGSDEWLHPFWRVTPYTAIDWCTRAARAARYDLPGPADVAGFRRGVLTGISSLGDSGVSATSLTVSQLLGMIANTRYPKLRVLETTDFHGAILPGARERRSRRAIGGTAVLAAWVARLRAENPEGTVLLDGGDCFQGTMISNLQFGRPVIEQMNLLGYTAAAIGNHDFDWSADTLAQRVAEMHFAALGANCIERKSGRRPRYARADTLITRRGVRVGILGLCYRETPTVTLARHVAHLRFDDDSATAARIVPELRAKGHATVVLAVGHVPAETDSTQRAKSGDLPRLARGVSNVDAWLGGHSHNLVCDTIGGVPVVIAGAHAEWIGVVDLTVDPVRGRVIERRARLQQTFADMVTTDSAMVARVERWNAGIGPVAAIVLGRNARRLVRGGDATVGYLVTDAMRRASGVDIAMQNSGGLRADLPAGEITKGGIYEVMPFENTIVTMELTGAEVRQAIEEGLKFGRVAQVSGLRFTFDSARPEMQRVITITLPDGTPLDEQRTFKVGVNNFMATGGDNYFTLARGRHSVDTQLTVRDAMETLVKEKCAGGGTLDYAPEARSGRVGDAPGR